MYSLVKRPSTMYKPYHNEQLCTHIVIHESFLLYFILKIVARLGEAEAPCFMKNASASGSSKSQMLPSSLPLPQKFNRFQLPLPHPWFG